MAKSKHTKFACIGSYQSTFPHLPPKQFLAPHPPSLSWGIGSVRRIMSIVFWGADDVPSRSVHFSEIWPCLTWHARSLSAHLTQGPLLSAENCILCCRTASDHQKRLYGTYLILQSNRQPVGRLATLPRPISFSLSHLHSFGPTWLNFTGSAF